MSAANCGHGASSPTRKPREPKCFDPRPQSLNPGVEYPPIGTEERDQFLYDLALVGAAPFMQCCPTHPFHELYTLAAAANRGEIAEQLV